MGSRLLSVLRLVAALLFLQHGTAKFFGFPYVEYLAGTPVLSLWGIAGVLEVVGGILLALGLFTRPGAFVLSGEMAFAYFLEHIEVASSHCSIRASRRCSTASSSSISPPPAAGPGASTRCSGEGRADPLVVAPPQSRTRHSRSVVASFARTGSSHATVSPATSRARRPSGASARLSAASRDVVQMAT